MIINAKAWATYITKLRKINDAAAMAATRYIATHDILTEAGTEALIEYCYGLATKYGEAAGSLAAEMYDRTVKASGRTLPPAEPARTATYGEVAKTVRGIQKQTENTEVISSGVGRLVKMSGVDTTMKNALRDGAEWAWIPTGETCAFCLTLASQGWQRASKEAIKGGHAEHIHANCDCTYAIRFDGEGDVEGYDPQIYRDIYYSAEGNSPRERINSMRRQFYAENKGQGLANVNAINDTGALPTFIPAKSIAEAEDFALQFTNGGKYSNVDYAGIDLQYANEFNRALNDVLSQYDPKYKLRNIEPMNMRSKAFKGSTADAAYRWGSNDLFYNKAYFKSEKDLTKHIAQYRELIDQVLPNADMLIDKYSQESGYLAKKQLDYIVGLKESGVPNVSGADPYGTMVHELGHYLDDTVFSSAYKENNFDIGESYREYSKGISAYATESRQEYVAESFLSYWKGETDSLDPKLIGIFERAKK